MLYNLDFQARDLFVWFFFSFPIRYRCSETAFQVQPYSNILFFFFKFHFRAPWGTEPYVALRFVYYVFLMCP